MLLTDVRGMQNFYDLAQELEMTSVEQTLEVFLTQRSSTNEADVRPLC